MSSPLLALEPSLLWKHFDDIRQIPRPSGHEEAVIAHLRSWAENRKFEVRSDAVGNLVIKVPATPGHENAPTVILQGHVDMVCEKNADVDHDFMTQGIQVKVEGDWVRAGGTTLGADNGIGVAMGLAVAEDPEAVHGPLEILLTIDEESGLTGAKQLDPAIVEGRLMINLDTEEDGAIYIGCAGGGDLEAHLPVTRHRAALSSVPVRVAVTGLRGGHSGLNIIENRGNGIRLATRLLIAAGNEGIEFDVVSIEAGSKHNAIPREAFAVIRVQKGSLERLQAVADRCLADFRVEFAATDPDLAISLSELDDQDDYQLVLDSDSRDRLLLMLDSLPNGVHTMSRDVPGLVETSSNLAVIKTGADEIAVLLSHRSSIMPALLAARQQAESACRQAGCSIALDEAYPGWQPNPDSELVKRTVDVHERLFGRKPEVKAIHAGLECGLLIEKAPGLDAVSIGPQIENAHSPDEQVQVSSVNRCYDLLKAMLVDLA